MQTPTVDQIKRQIIREYGAECEGLTSWIEEYSEAHPSFIIHSWSQEWLRENIYELTLDYYVRYQGHMYKDSKLFQGKRQVLPQPIYRDYSCTLSQKNCTNLLQALAISKGSITSQFTLGNGFPEKSVNRWTMFFRLRFMTQDYLDKFHSFGLETTEPEKVVGCSNPDPDSYYAQRDIDVSNF